MSLTLLHGPIGATDLLLKHLEENHQASDTFIFIIPHERLVEEVQQKILGLEAFNGILLGQPVVSMHHFLLNLMKANTTRLHKTSPRITRSIIRNILFSKSWPSFEKHKQFFYFIESISSAILALKKNTLSPADVKKMMSSYHSAELEDFLNIFSAYNNDLRKNYYYDEGDYITETLRLTKEKKLALPPNLKTIYIDRIFPLSLGERELINALSKNYPNLEIVISYSFNYQETDDTYLYPAYAQLGEMATKTNYVPVNSSNETTKLSFTDPYSETKWLIQQIEEKLTAGIPPSKIGIILPSHPYYAKRFIDLCNEKNWPMNTGSLSLTTEISEMDAKKLIHLNLTENTDKKLQNIIDHNLTILGLQQEFKEAWEFEKNIFISPGNLSHSEKWHEDELRLIKVKLPQNLDGLHFINTSEASLFDFDYLFVVGFTDQLYPSTRNIPSFYTAEMLEDPALREILAGPSLHTAIEKNLLNQAIFRAKQTVLTYPRLMWEGRECLPARLLLIENNHEAVPQEKDLHELLPYKSDYPTIKKNRFSISALETYLKCPYQYYARTHLKLGELPDEEIDPPGDVKGNIIHHALYYLYKDNLPLYTEALEYDLYLNKFLTLAQNLIKQEIAKDTFFSQSLPELKTLFEKRSIETLNSYITNEIKLIREKKKTTLPRYFEWGFGAKEIPPLKIDDIYITGRIDRIDVCDKTKTFTVIDYKTGTIDSGKQIREGKSLQIPLYMMATAQILLPNYKPAGGYLVNLGELDKPSGLFIDTPGGDNLLKNRIAQQEWTDIKEKISTLVKTVVANIHKGLMSPNPKENSLCLVCDYKEICNYNIDEDGD